MSIALSALDKRHRINAQMNDIRLIGQIGDIRNRMSNRPEPILKGGEVVMFGAKESVKTGIRNGKVVEVAYTQTPRLGVVVPKTDSWREKNVVANTVTYRNGTHYHQVHVIGQLARQVVAEPEVTVLAQSHIEFVGMMIAFALLMGASDATA